MLQKLTILSIHLMRTGAETVGYNDAVAYVSPGTMKDAYTDGRSGATHAWFVQN